MRWRVTQWLGALAAAILWAGGAQAQAPDAPPVISPLRVETDLNNVNIISGKTTVELPVLSVPAAPNLRFDRVQNAAPYVSGRVNTATPQGGISTASFSIHAGGAASESFQCEDYDCRSVTGTGSTFVQNARIYRQAGTGAVWHFTLLHSISSGGTPVAVLYYAPQVTYANGEVISYSYDTATMANDPFPGRTFYRPNKIASSMGYEIRISYQGSDFNADPGAWSRPGTATLYRTSPETALRRFTYSGDTITDNGSTLTDTSDDRTFTCTGCGNQLGIDLEVNAGSLQLPGESTPSVSISPVSGPAPLVQSVTQDGVQWSYAYLNPRLSGTNWLFDRVTVTGPNSFNQVYNIVQVDVARYQQRNVIQSITDSIGRTTTLQFDEAYRPTRITYPEGNAVGVGYDDFGNIIWRTAYARPASGLANITESASFPTGSCLMNGTPVLCYRPTWRRDALNRQTDYLHNDRGQLTQEDEPADANGVRRRTIIEYTMSPSPAAPISRPTRVTVCGAGASAGTCAAGQQIVTEYDYVGDTLLVGAERRIDPAGPMLVTTNSYDAEGRLVASDGPMAGTADTSYNRYDAFGRPAGTISADPAIDDNPRLAVRTTYDQAGRAIKVETGHLWTLPSEAVAPANWADFTTDRATETQYAQNRKIRELVREGSTGPARMLTEHSYDASGRLDCTAVRMNPAAFALTGTPNACLPNTAGSDGPDRITRNIYDAAGQRLQLREGVGSTAGSLGGAVEAAEATWAYNLNGQVTTVIDGNGNRAELRYDGHMRQDRWTFPSATRPASFDDSSQATALATAGSVNAADYEEYGYDTAGNRISLRKRDGSTLQYQYDNLNRNIVKIVPERTGLDPSYTHDVYYGYDLRNAQLYARFDSHSGPGISNSYDAFGRLTSATTDFAGPAPRTLTYSYDPHGNRTSIAGPDSAVFSIGYDGLDRPLTLYGQGIGWLARQYRGWGGETIDFHRISTVTHEINGFETTFSDGLQRPASRVRNWYWGGLVTWTYQRNAAGQLSSVSRDNDAYAWTGHYAVQRPYTTNGLNQYSAAGGASFTYDSNGNLRTAPGPGGSTITYTYDVENRLVGASQPMTGGGGPVQLGYDPLGRLAWTTGSPNFTRFLYDGDNLVAEYDYGGAMTRRYVHWVGTDVPFLDFQGADFATPRYLYADHQGSIVSATDASTATVHINRYDEYGIPAMNAAGENINTGRFQYTGQIWLPELGMYHYKARIYSPTLGRFLQVDPIGYEDQFNLYAYVGNDPVNLTDPTGEEGACTYAPGACGMRPLTATEIQRRDQAYHDVGWAGLSVIPIERAIVLGTRFFRALITARRAIAPEARATSTLRPGPHARESIPARGPGPLNAAEQRQVNRIGNRHGCHTCGTHQPGTRSGNWVGDHQRPSALNPHGEPQRIYPQCLRCSLRQGGEVRQALKLRHAGRRDED